MLAILSILLSAPTFACGPYGGAAVTLQANDGAPVARYNAWFTQLEVRDGDTWKAVEVDMVIESVRMVDGRLRLTGWSHDKHITETRNLRGERVPNRKAVRLSKKSA